MAASYLLSECLEKIFLNLLENPSGNTCIYTTNKDLYSCTLVSRHWCRISTPLIYAYPFHHFRASNRKHVSYFKLIRTLLSCVPKSEIEQIILNSSNEQEFSFSDVLETFNYISFIRGLIFDIILSNPSDLSYYQEIWFPYTSNNEDQLSKISFPIINHLVKFMCKHCNNLTTLEFPFTIQNHNEFFNNIIEWLTYKNSDGDSKLSDLKEFYYINRSNSGIIFSPKDIYFALSNSICNLNLLYNEGINSIKIAKSLSQFISLQKKLQRIILIERSTRNNIDDDYNIVFNSLSTQSESLQILEFKELSFNKMNEEALNSLCSLKNIKELKLYWCKEINDDLNHWAENLTKLEAFEFEGRRTIPENFLIQLVQSSSSTLTKLVLHYKREHGQGSQLLKQIPILHSLIHLELPKIFPTELIYIFKTCTRLVYLSVILSKDRILWEEDFENLGKFIPKNLQRIQFQEMDHLVFNSNELKFFFEECVNSGSNLKYLKIIGKCYGFGQEYFDVAKEFGIELIKA